jgi:subtilisin family serine protease
VGRHRVHLLIVIASLAATALMIAAAPAAGVAPGQTRAHVADARYVPGQAIVRLRDDVSLAAAARLAIGNDARVTDRLPRAPGDGHTVVVSSASLSTAELIDQLKTDPRVDRVEPDYLLHLDATPNDPDLPSLWGMTQIRTPGAWDLSTGSSSVVLASIDTGVDYTHPDLAANMWHNPGEVAGNGLDDDGNGYVDDVYGMASASDAVDPSDPMDVQGHGTHTAGTMAGVGDNGTGVAGVAWHTSVMALRFFNAKGLGATSDAIACIEYVIAMKERGVNVVAINASWGSSENSAFLRWAIEAAGDAGIIVVAAAGNGGADKVGDDNEVEPYYPASYDCANIVSVGASDATDALTGFSNYGAASVDLVAPGIDIWSTVPTAMVPAGYGFKKGTSMAAPHVTGTIALCAALYPGETAAERTGRVLGSADPVASLAGKCVTGGRLDVLGALDTAAPVTTTVGADDAWHNTPVTVAFAAVDAGSKVAYVEYSLDGAAFARGTDCVVSGDAVHTLAYRAADNAGNVEVTRIVTVRVDAGRPVTRALARVTVRKGRRATMRFAATDLAPRARFTIKVFKGGRAVKTLRPGLRATNTALTHVWRCRLARGTYTWKVYAADLAGNTQSKVGRRILTVR